MKRTIQDLNTQQIQKLVAYRAIAPDFHHRLIRELRRRT